MKPAIDRIIDATCEYTNTPKSLLLSPVRNGEVCRVRDMVIWTAYRSGHTYSAIGRALGRDHTTIIHSARKTGAA